jgi:hypothetical protein
VGLRNSLLLPHAQLPSRASKLGHPGQIKGLCKNVLVILFVEHNVSSGADTICSVPKVQYSIVTKKKRKDNVSKIRIFLPEGWYPFFGVSYPGILSFYLTMMAFLA